MPTINVSSSLSLAGLEANWPLESSATVRDGGNFLQEAAEELGQFFSRFRDERKKSEDSGFVAYVDPDLTTVEEVEAILAVLWDEENGGKPHDVAAALLENPDDPQARALLRRQAPSANFALLEWAITRGTEVPGRAPSKERLRDLRDRIYADSGEQIRADFNISHLNEFGAGRAGRDNRQSYHDVLLCAGDLPRTLQSLCSIYGKNVEGAVAAFRRAISRDMQSPSSSLSSERLEVIRHALYLMSIVLPVLDNCRVLAERAALRQPNAHDSVQAPVKKHELAVDLLSDIIELVPKWVEESDVRRFLYKYGVPVPVTFDQSILELDFRQLLTFLRELREIVRLIPGDVFPEDHKFHTLDVIAGMQDQYLLGSTNEESRASP